MRGRPGLQVTCGDKQSSKDRSCGACCVELESCKGECAGDCKSINISQSPPLFLSSYTYCTSNLLDPLPLHQPHPIPITYSQTMTQRKGFLRTLFPGHKDSHSQRVPCRYSDAEYYRETIINELRSTGAIIEYPVGCLTIQELERDFPERSLQEVKHMVSARRKNSNGSNETFCYPNEDEICCSICQEYLGEEGSHSSACSTSSASSSSTIGQESYSARLLTCGHAFHSSCIKEWLIKFQGVCPVCKTEMKSKNLI